MLWHENDRFVLAAGILYRAQVDRSVKEVVTGLDTNVDRIELLSGDKFIVSCSTGIIERKEKQLLDWVRAGNQEGLDTLFADALSYVAAYERLVARCACDGSHPY